MKQNKDEGPITNIFYSKLYKLRGNGWAGSLGFSEEHELWAVRGPFGDAGAHAFVLFVLAFWRLDVRLGRHYAAKRATASPKENLKAGFGEIKKASSYSGPLLFLSESGTHLFSISISNN